MRPSACRAATALLVLSLATPGVPRAQGASAARATALPAPRLVVAILIDQYRDDYLDRFRPVFGRDGFVRLMDGGARFRDCTIPYSPTLTGPGHATWLSGTTPAVHGIAANEWFDRAEGGLLEAATDTSVRAVGVAPGRRGTPASPRWMRAETVADVLRATTRGAGKVVALSDKARGAVLPAGRHPTGAFWLDDDTGLLQTSTYYAGALPAWAQVENARREADVAAARRTPWERALPPAAYAGTAPGDPRDRFPHPIRTGPDDRRPEAVSLTAHPFALQALFDFAEAAVTHEGLGADDVPDLLILSVSVTDRVGHDFGPDSEEVLDLAHRLDARLATFLARLDRTVGRGRWAVTLTSDHGVAPSVPVAREFAVDPGDSIGSINAAQIRRWIDRIVPAALAKTAPRAAGLTGWARAVWSGLVTLDDSVLAVAGVTHAQAARVVADSAAGHPRLAAGFAGEDLRAGHVSGAIGQRAERGYVPGRSGDAVLVPRSYAYWGTYSGWGTSHGTPYRYDTHVPFVMYGWGVRPGTFRDPVSTVDIAPTVAALLGVDAPAQSEGRVLAEGLAIPGPLPPPATSRPRRATP